MTTVLNRSLALLLILCAMPARAAVVLQYHHVSATTPSSTSVTPDRFAMHLEYLAGHGFEIVPLDVLAEALQNGQPLPDKTAAITFDDGYRSIYAEAFPLLKQRHWPFTVFINTAPHDREQAGFMTWDQLRELSQYGATIGNHTVSHPYLLEHRPGQDEQAWRDWVSAEISDAGQRIRQETGTEPKLFAYPYGEYDQAILEIVAGLGYTGFGQQSGPLADFDDPRVLPRFPFGGVYGDREDFAVKVNTLPMPLAGGKDTIRRELENRELLSDIVFTGVPVRPVLALHFADGFNLAKLRCFVTGQGQAAVSLEPPWAIVQAAMPLQRGRARYNCTAPAPQVGRYYWLSQMWIVR